MNPLHIEIVHACIGVDIFAQSLRARNPAIDLQFLRRRGIPWPHWTGSPELPLPFMFVAPLPSFRPSSPAGPDFQPNGRECPFSQGVPAWR